MIVPILCMILFFISAFINLPILILVENKKQRWAIPLIIITWIGMFFLIYKFSRTYGIAWLSGFALSILSMPLCALYDKLPDFVKDPGIIFISVVQAFVVIAASSLLWCFFCFLTNTTWFYKLTVIISYIIYLQNPSQLLDIITLVPVLIWSYKTISDMDNFDKDERFYLGFLAYIWVIVARFIWFKDFSFISNLSSIVPCIICLKNIFKEYSF